jgi:hypothetical protein
MGAFGSKELVRMWKTPDLTSYNQLRMRTVLLAARKLLADIFPLKEWR